jgi:hypothetical protein
MNKHINLLNTLNTIVDFHRTTYRKKSKIEIKKRSVKNAKKFISEISILNKFEDTYSGAYLEHLLNEMEKNPSKLYTHLRKSKYPDLDIFDFSVQVLNNGNICLYHDNNYWYVDLEFIQSSQINCFIMYGDEIYIDYVTISFEHAIFSLVEAVRYLEEDELDYEDQRYDGDNNHRYDSYYDDGFLDEEDGDNALTDNQPPPPEIKEFVHNNDNVYSVIKHVQNNPIIFTIVFEEVVRYVFYITYLHQEEDDSELEVFVGYIPNEISYSETIFADIDLFVAQIPEHFRDIVIDNLNLKNVDLPD